MPLPSDFVRSRLIGHNLTEVLAKGALPLEEALGYATEIAYALREMHQDGRAHGSVDEAHVLVRSSGATLVPTERRGYTDQLDDLAGFGRVLYALLSGRPPGAAEMRLVPARPSLVRGPTAVRAAALRLAERCLAADRGTAPDFQKIVTEVRLLHVMAKQFSPETAGLRAASPPFSVPAQSLEVYAGKAPPVIHPPSPPAVAAVPAAVADSASAAAPAPQPGENSVPTVRARSSHSRPVLQDVMCPKCNGCHVRLSRPRTPFESFLNLIGIGVHRCHRCFYRYIPLLGRKLVRKAKCA